MITIWIPMRFGRCVLFGCAVLSTAAGLPVRTTMATLILDQPVQERAILPESPGLNGG
jgi:hypothetical protein